VRHAESGDDIGHMRYSPLFLSSRRFRPAFCNINAGSDRWEPVFQRRCALGVMSESR
jgi:hypothetical protein